MVVVGLRFINVGTHSIIFGLIWDPLIRPIWKLTE